MALYYFNIEKDKYTFYTDQGSIFNLLKFAGENEIISIKYLLGHNQFSGRLVFLRNGRSSKDLNSSVRNFMPASVQTKFVSASNILSTEFDVQFQNGTIASCRDGNTTVMMPNSERFVDLCDAYRIPPKIVAIMLSQPGSLLNVVRSTVLVHGHFKFISDWIDQPAYEKRICALYRDINLN